VSSSSSSRAEPTSEYAARARYVSREMDDTRTLRPRGATTPRHYGATPLEGGEDASARRRGAHVFVLRRTVLLFAVAVVAALAAIAFTGAHARTRAMITTHTFGAGDAADDDVATDPTPEPVAVPEADIQDVIPSGVKLSDDVPTAACACDATVTETIAFVLDSVPLDCARLASMDKTCFSTAACDALKASVNLACPGSISSS
jgi:hypothetical protein